MAEDTPLFAQYQKIKNQHPNEVLFFRVGDFYEMFDSDADEVSKLLNLTLTHRAEKHMCGIPVHAMKIYVARLLRSGKKIAIAEQVGEIATHGKGITERKVVEIITPGTAVESEYLDGGANNFLASVFVSNGQVGFAYIDVTTGEFRATSFPESALMHNLPKEIGRSNPRELLLPNSLHDSPVIAQIVSDSASHISLSWYPDWNFNAELAYKRLVRQFKTANLRSFSLVEDSPEVPPAGFLLDYLEKTTNAPSSHITSISVYSDDAYVIIDDDSRRNLEITENIRDGSTEFSLLDCVNYTKTAMGNRLLREWLSFPLTDITQIQARQSHVELFVQDRSTLRRVQEKLNGILDIERLAARIAMDKAHAKDLQALRQSLELWLKAQECLSAGSFANSPQDFAQEIISLIQSAILDDPSTLLSEGRVIKPLWSEELDHWKNLQTNFSNILADYEEEERERTGIQNLRIRKNGNLGYFIEVTKGKLDKVPEHFIIRRALVNAERYTTAKLQELEASLNESDTHIIELERALFIEVRNKLKVYVPKLQQAAREIAYADVCSSLAYAAIAHNWVRPEVEESRLFCVKDGRHPVVEKHLPTGEFVPNDLELCAPPGEKKESEAFFALITGPNMAGKSTFLRQNALIAVLAQIGSFVPCASARLGIVDRIFCRVGASDNLARGESTFLVEMTETAHILRSATEKSLVIMDEVGRGTSTEDGLSIAWAVSEYLVNSVKCKTLFATHYHELTRLDHPAIVMLCMAVAEESGTVAFLRKVILGASKNSYGIHVASLAGVPQPVLERATYILNRIQEEAALKPIIPLGETDGAFLQQPDSVPKKMEAAAQEAGRGKNQHTEERGAASLTGALFSDEELILDEILSLDIDNITPLNALKILSRFKKTLSGT